MIAILEAILGSKTGRIVAEILAGAAIVTIFALHFEHKGATTELAKLQVSSTKLIAQAQKDIQAETAKHAADVKANQEKTNAALAANAALQSSLSQRVRDFDAYRRAHPDVPRPAGGFSAAQPGECGASSCGDLAVQLATAGDELAGSSGKLAVALQSCQRDRDSLTGLPK